MHFLLFENGILITAIWQTRDCSAKNTGRSTYTVINSTRAIKLLKVLIEYHLTLRHDHFLPVCECSVTIEFKRIVHG